MMKKNDEFSVSRAREIALKVLQKNTYFAHHEHILQTMLGDSEKEVRAKAIKLILDIIQIASLEENQKSQKVRQFVIPFIDCKATIYLEMSSLAATKLTEPPAIRNKPTLDIKAYAENKLQLIHPCHNQVVERHIKLVTEAATTVEGFLRRDGMIRQKIKSRRLMKCFESKKQFSI